MSVSPELTEDHQPTWSSFFWLRVQHRQQIASLLANYLVSHSILSYLGQNVCFSAISQHLPENMLKLNKAGVRFASVITIIVMFFCITWNRDEGWTDCLREGGEPEILFHQLLYPQIFDQGFLPLLQNLFPDSTTEKHRVIEQMTLKQHWIAQEFMKE